MTELVKSIFREYDIRGIYPDELNEDSIAVISKSIAQKCHKESINEVVIAHMYVSVLLSNEKQQKLLF